MYQVTYRGEPQRGNEPTVFDGLCTFTPGEAVVFTDDFAQARGGTSGDNLAVFLFDAKNGVYQRYDRNGEPLYALEKVPSGTAKSDKSKGDTSNG